MPTDKQARYIMVLLSQKGFDTRYMDARYKALGARMRERSGTVEGWVNGLDIGRAGEVIDTLTALPDKRGSGKAGRRRL